MTLIEQVSAYSLLLHAHRDGLLLWTATGFVVKTKRGHLLITNRHVVTGRDDDAGVVKGIPNAINVLHHLPDEPGKQLAWAWRDEPLLDERNEPLWIEIKSRPDVDVVALPLTNVDGIHLEAHLMNREEVSPVRLGPAEMVSVIGFPFGKPAGGGLPIWTTGFIASEPAIEVDGRPLVLIDARTRAGQSGSQVVAYRPPGWVRVVHGTTHSNEAVWRFIGVYSGRIDKDSDIGRVWKAPVVDELIRLWEERG